MAQDVNGYLTADLHSPAMTKPDISHGEAPYPKQVGIRQLLPDSWIGSTLELSYIGADGGPASVRGVYLDRCGSGPILRQRTGVMAVRSCFPLLARRCAPREPASSDVGSALDERQRPGVGDG